MTGSISIITPSYNQHQFIERSIQSVLSQNIEKLEYHIIDGGSTDGTLDILKKYDNKLKWTSELDRGQSHAVNKGIARTSGSIIGWLNSDDIYYPNTLKKVREIFINHPMIDILYGDAYHIDVSDQVIDRYYTEAWNLERLKNVCFLCQPAVFFRRRLVEQFGLLNENLQYCMDYEYWLRLANKGVNFYYFPTILAGSRLHPQTKTLSSSIKVHREINTMLRTSLKKVPTRWLINYAHAVVNTHFNHLSLAKQRRMIAYRTVFAALYWNKWIDKSLLKLAMSWFSGSFTHEC